MWRVAVWCSAEGCLADGAALSGSMTVKLAVEEVDDDSQAGQIKNACSTLSSQLCLRCEQFSHSPKLQCVWKSSCRCWAPPECSQVLSAWWYLPSAGLAPGANTCFLRRRAAATEPVLLQWPWEVRLILTFLFNFCVVCPLVYKMLGLREWMNGILESFCSLCSIGLWL